jgi:putative PIN family toxin of toxin-antitoxin system
MIEAVFDTNIYLQAASKNTGPAGACWDLVEQLVVTAYLTVDILDEIEGVLNRPKIRKQIPKLTDDHVDEMLSSFRSFAEIVDTPPEIFELPRDQADAKFVNLALYTKSSFLVTRDRDLLELRDDSDFFNRFPGLEIVTPVGFLEVVRAIK